MKVSLGYPLSVFNKNSTLKCGENPRPFPLLHGSQTRAGSRDSDKYKKDDSFLGMRQRGEPESPRISILMDINNL